MTETREYGVFLASYSPQAEEPAYQRGGMKLTRSYGSRLRCSQLSILCCLCEAQQYQCEYERTDWELPKTQSHVARQFPARLLPEIARLRITVGIACYANDCNHLSTFTKHLHSAYRIISKLVKYLCTHNLNIYLVCTLHSVYFQSADNKPESATNCSCLCFISVSPLSVLRQTYTGSPQIPVCCVHTELFAPVIMRW